MKKKFAWALVSLWSLVMILLFQNFSSTSLNALSGDVAELNVRFDQVKSLWPYQSCEVAGSPSDPRPFNRMYFCNEVPAGDVDLLGSEKKIETLKAAYLDCKRRNLDLGSEEIRLGKYLVKRKITCERKYQPDIQENEAARSQWRQSKEIYSSKLSFQDREKINRVLPVVVRMERTPIPSSVAVRTLSGSNQSVFLERVHGRHILNSVKSGGSQYIELCSYFPGMKLTGLPTKTKYTIERNWLFSYSVDIHLNPGSFKFDHTGMCLLGKANPYAPTTESLFQVIGLKPVQLSGAQFEGLRVKVDAGWLGNFVLDIASKVITGMNLNTLVTNKVRSQLNTYASSASQGMGSHYLSQSEFERVLNSVDSSNPVAVFTGQYLQELYKLNVMADHSFVSVRDAVQRVRAAVRDGSIQQYIAQADLESIKAQYQQKVDSELMAPARQRLSSESSRLGGQLEAEKAKLESNLNQRLNARFSELKQLLDREASPNLTYYRSQLQVRQKDLLAESDRNLSAIANQLVVQGKVSLDQQLKPAVDRLRQAIASSGLSASVKSALDRSIVQSLDTIRSVLKASVDSRTQSAKAQVEANLNRQLQSLMPQLVKTPTSTAPRLSGTSLPRASSPRASLGGLNER